MDAVVLTTLCSSLLSHHLRRASSFPPPRSRSDPPQLFLSQHVKTVIVSHKPPHRCVFGLFSRNIGLAVDQFQHVLDSHRWVPIPAIKGGARSAGGDENGEDVAPPYSLMEHPPVAAFVNGKWSLLIDVALEGVCLHNQTPLASRAGQTRALSAPNEYEYCRSPWKSFVMLYA